jgi:hypothetical protein
MSLQDHPEGQNGGAVGVIDTESNWALPTAPALCEVTARPADNVPLKLAETALPDTDVHVLPSGDV